MEKKKIYIFVAFHITTIGGMQLHTAGISKYLENSGWKVYIFTPEPSNAKTAIPYLNPYLKVGGDCTFLSIPPYKLHYYEQEVGINIMLQKLNIKNFQECEIVVESCESARSFWAELLASRIGARHFFMASEEEYRTADRYYEENLDFYYFKLQRNELICNNLNMLLRLFNGYKNVTKLLYPMPSILLEENPVQDVSFPVINQIQKLDWNICHIGRISKDFVPYAIEGVAQLARRHPDKSINFIFVGDITARKDFIIKTFQDIDNVQITALGDLVPIPRILFSKIDVICAIAGSAYYTANEGPYVLLGNLPNPEKTPGVFGYDTRNTIYGEVKYTWVEALENVLVKRFYDDKELTLYKIPSPELVYNNLWTILKNAAPEKKYYVERLSRERIRDWTAIFPFGAIARDARIILFGANEIAKDYRKQIQSQNDSTLEFGEGYIKQFNQSQAYCTIVATVDEHPEEFDNSVVGIERLLQKDYDAIILCVFPQQVQAAYNKIIQTVPDMKNRVVYDFKTLQT